jgi:hypothetical protein
VPRAGRRLQTEPRTIGTFGSWVVACWKKFAGKWAIGILRAPMRLEHHFAAGAGIAVTMTAAIANSCMVKPRGMRLE